MKKMNEILLENVISKDCQEPIFGNCCGSSGIAIHDSSEAVYCFLGGSDSLIKTYNLETKENISETLIKVGESEVDINNIIIRENSLIFACLEGFVCVLPIPKDLGQCFDLEKMNVIFKTTSPIRCLDTLGNFLAIGLTTSSIKVIDLSAPANEYPIYCSINLEESAGAIKTIKVVKHEQLNKLYIISSACDGSLRIFQVAEHTSKLIKTVGNFFDTDKNNDPTDTDKAYIMYSSSEEKLYLAGDKKIRLLSAKNWTEERAFCNLKSMIICYSKVYGSLIYISTSDSCLCVVDVKKKEIVLRVKMEDMINNFIFSKKFNYPVALLDTGDLNLRH